MNFSKIKRNFRRNTKAISPVIATLLMIAIAVVASLVAYAWVMGYMNFTTEKTGKAIQIQSVANYTSGTVANDYLTIYVQNVGDSAVVFNAQSVFIRGVMVTSNVASPTTLAAGNTIAIRANWAPNATSTATYTIPVTFTVDIKVTTQDGTFTTLTKTFP